MAAEELYSERFVDAPEPTEQQPSGDICELLLAIGDMTDVQMIEDLTFPLGIQLALSKSINMLCSGLAPVPPQLKVALLVLNRANHLDSKLKCTINNALDFL